VNYHKNQSNYATVLSAEVENSAGYGRLVRDKNANLLEIVEEKDATEIQKQIKEINTGTYVFNSPDVFEKLKSIGTNNAQKEYYLPDLLKIYHSENHKTGAFKLLNHLESSGVNSRDDLERLEIYISQGKVMAV
jgi:bifunctional N-acetylglucosamine-1-phosphate-uridyltransferase/glucosamine-1-phosphate-acetyltransferase GlmU-like protein